MPQTENADLAQNGTNAFSSGQDTPMLQAAQKYLIVKGIAGLGNRILSAVTGILFARLMHRRLIIDWSDFTYSNDETNVFPLLFTCTDEDPPLAIPETNSISPPLWRDQTPQICIRSDQ